MDANDELIEYLASIVPGAEVECAGCGVKREAAKAVVREKNFYCKAECADRALALYRKPEPPRVDCDGWSI